MELGVEYENPFLVEEDEKVFFEGVNQELESIAPKDSDEFWCNWVIVMTKQQLSIYKTAVNLAKTQEEIDKLTEAIKEVQRVAIEALKTFNFKFTPLNNN